MKKVMLSVAAAAILASCAPETGFDLTIDAQSAGDSPVKLSLENQEVLYEGTLSAGKLTVHIDDFPHQYAMVEIAELGMPAWFASSPLAQEALDNFKARNNEASSSTY